MSKVSLQLKQRTPAPAGTGPREGKGDMRHLRSRLLIGLAVLALVATAAACGSDDDSGSSGGGGGGGGGGEGDVTSVTAIIPFASGINFYPFLVGEEQGFFAEEGISMTVQAGEGSGAALQQVLAGQAEMCLCSPGPLLNAIGEGADLSAVYTLYQSDVYALVSPDGSEVTDIEGLRGTTIGVGTIDGGETSWLVALLGEAGLVQDEDYSLLAVGEGGAAIAGFERSEIDAYAAAFPDVAIMRLQGFDLQTIELPGSENFFDSLIVVDAGLVESDPELIEGIGRAVAKATVWGLDRDEEVIDITGRQFPEEVTDREFALALLEETQNLFLLPDSAEGQWGISVPERTEFLVDYLIEQGAAPEGVDTSVFDNQFVDAYNDFDPDAL